MRVLITGAQGYLGSYIVEILRHKQGVHLIPTGRTDAEGVLRCDLANRRDVESLLGMTLPDCVLHCAAYVPKQAEEYNEKNASMANVEMLRNLLDFSTCPLFFISSMTVYGEPIERPAKESDPRCPSSAYAESKSACEELLEHSGRSGFALRLPGLFGLPRRSGVVYNVLSALKKTEVVRLPEHPVVWASMDVCDASLSIAQLILGRIPKSFKVLNIGYRGGQSLNLLLQYASKISGNEPLKYTVRHPFFEFDLENAEHYGVVPSISFYDALERLYGLL
ncbi:MAG: NAD(P)-dependent oxidoreductase [Clostridia bacterium]|nr:NAD(P)-dependent oxidoreductase [Clostridia bacterium]